MALSDIMEINQEEYATQLDIAIETGTNLLIFGPSGGGKTSMVQQACERNNAILSHCNLSVNERPDIQGWPMISADSPIAKFATPAYIPLPETLYHNEKIALMGAIKTLQDRGDTSSASELQKRIDEIKAYEDSVSLAAAIPYIKNVSLKNKDTMIKDLQSVIAATTMGRRSVINFDEADKAPHEVLQPLLELLQFRKLNGRKLAIDCCILTCNLPDEGAHTERLSHAITNRCRIYKLNLDFKVWQTWAVKNGVNPLIVGFLARNSQYFHKKPSNDDDTAYAHPSPRAWTDASLAINSLEKIKSHSFQGDSLVDMQVTTISGHVGHEASAQFEVWLKHYSKLDPAIENIVNGKKVNIDDYSIEEQIVLAIGACATIMSCASKVDISTDEGKKKLHNVTKNVAKFLSTTSTDMQTAGLRNTLDFDFCLKAGLSTVKELMDIFKNIQNRTQ
jgi:ABC-type cobalamin/Fe3+-siderophores transport system ATPase subunit